MNILTSGFGCIGGGVSIEIRYMIEKPLFCRILILFGLFFVSVPHSVYASSPCGNLEKNIPQNLDLSSVISDLLGHALVSKSENANVRFFHHPSIPDVYVVWAWENERLSTGTVRLVSQNDRVRHQWVSEPLRQMPLSRPPKKIQCTPYKLGALEHVFGFTTETTGPYAGGGWSEEQLWLFADYKGKLLNILETPIERSELIAGEWKKKYREHFDCQVRVTLSSNGKKLIPDVKRIISTTYKEVGPSGKMKLVSKKKYEQHMQWNESKKVYDLKKSDYDISDGCV